MLSQIFGDRMVRSLCNTPQQRRVSLVGERIGSEPRRISRIEIQIGDGGGIVSITRFIEDSRPPIPRMVRTIKVLHLGRGSGNWEGEIVCSANFGKDKNQD